MTNVKFLMTPGPVELPQGVLQAGSHALISHRCPAFSELFAAIEKKLSVLFDSSGPYIILPSSGTGALECLVQNFFDKNTKYISVSCGAFGHRFREIAGRTGAKGTFMDTLAGEAVDPSLVADVVKAHPECSILLLTQNETSTGVVNPVADIINALPRENRPLVLVDGVSACGAMECFPEKWGIDGLATASQKGLLTAPGLGLVWLSKRAWDILDGRKCGSYYFDLLLHKKKIDTSFPENPYTPPISLYYELDEALDEILENGTKSWFDSHRRYARAFAAGLEAMGCELLVKNKKYRSPGVTAFSMPGCSTETVRAHLREFGIETAGGQGDMKGKLIRAAHYNLWGWSELCVILGGLYAASGMADNGIEPRFLSAAWKEWNLEGK